MFTWKGAMPLDKKKVLKKFGFLLLHVLERWRAKCPASSYYAKLESPWNVSRPRKICEGRHSDHVGGNSRDATQLALLRNPYFSKYISHQTFVMSTPNYMNNDSLLDKLTRVLFHKSWKVFEVKHNLTLWGQVRVARLTSNNRNRYPLFPNHMGIHLHDELIL